MLDLVFFLPPSVHVWILQVTLGSHTYIFRHYLLFILTRNIFSFMHSRGSIFEGCHLVVSSALQEPCVNLIFGHFGICSSVGYTI